MSCYDTFIDPETGLEAQLKCFGSQMLHFKVGDHVPVKEFGIPYTCTILSWGGSSTKFFMKNVLGEMESAGTFVIIKEGVLERITEDENEIVGPVYTKYGEQYQ